MTFRPMHFVVALFFFDNFVAPPIIVTIVRIVTLLRIFAGCLDATEPLIVLARVRY